MAFWSILSYKVNGKGEANKTACLVNSIVSTTSANNNRISLLQFLSDVAHSPRFKSSSIISNPYPSIVTLLPIPLSSLQLTDASFMTYLPSFQPLCFTFQPGILLSNHLERSSDNFHDFNETDDLAGFIGDRASHIRARPFHNTF